MKTDLYTKLVLTALTLGVVALVFQRAEFDLSPVSTVEAKGKQVARKAHVINGKIYRLVGYWTGEMPGRLISIGDTGNRSLLFATLSDCQEGARYWTQRDQKEAEEEAADAIKARRRAESKTPRLDHFQRKLWVENYLDKAKKYSKNAMEARSRRYACVSVQPTFNLP